MSKTRAAWSIPTWFFLHGFAEKINETYYNNNYGKCFNIIRRICNNIPCEICRTHASYKMKLTKDHMINTKEKLINFLFDFHNEVSQRVGNTMFDKTILIKYKTYNIRKGYDYFVKSYFKKYYSLNFYQWIRDKFLDDLDEEMATIWEFLD